MDDSTLIATLEQMLAAGQVSRRDTPFVRECLPALRDGTLNAADRADLLEIAREHASPASSTTASNLASHNTAGRDLNQTTQSGGVNLDNADVDQIGRINAGDEVHRDKVLGDKIVYAFYGHTPPTDGEPLLRAYLRRVVENNSDLHLYRMTRKTQKGSGQDVLPPLKLADVYTNVTVDGDAVRLYARERPAAWARRMARRIRTQSADAVPPEQVRELATWLDDDTAARWRQQHPQHEQLTWDALEDDVPVQIALTHPPLALESIAQQGRLVLLGDPGMGKSTLLRYLALLLAHHLLDSAHPLPIGWRDADPPPVPLFCSLAVAADGLRGTTDNLGRDTLVLWQALKQQLEGVANQREGLSAYLRLALQRRGVLLLLDGLDEISAAPDASGVSLRSRMSAAIANLARDLPRNLPIVVTCRVLPYQQPDDDHPRNRWTLPADDGWTVRTLQPWVGGQVRQFARSWYRAACGGDNPIYTAAAGAQRAEQLIAELQQERLRVLTESPLLLTMLTILHYNRPNATLPTTEAELYEECVTLLLERWEPVRTIGYQRPGLLEELNLDRTGKTLDDVRSILHRVAFEAHNRPPDPSDGRGVLRRTELEGELRVAFKRWRCDDRDGKIDTFIHVLRVNAALLHEVADDRYVFPHLTFQEFLAACWLADAPDLDTRAYEVWSGPDGDRWRKVLLLLAGRLRAQGKVNQIGWAWLHTLLRTKAPDRATKSARQRQLDALLAYDSYREWDGRTPLSNRDGHELERLEGDMAQALATVLHREPLATHIERLAAGAALAALGDPRPGVCTPEPDWCDVPAGEYVLGSDDSDPQAQDREKPPQTVVLAAFQVSRYPVTNAQWRMFIEAGGYTNPGWWVYGWDVREAKGWTEPRYWTNEQFNAPNQPVVGISWYEAMAYCAWLSAELEYVVTLPTEAQWEAAARGTDRRIYPWGDDWDAERANTDASNIGRTTAVGVYPHGASPCGALDMSGNVYEWTRSNFNERDYTNVLVDINNSTSVSFRGDAWNYGPQYARCAYRNWNVPRNRLSHRGCRIFREA